MDTLPQLLEKLINQSNLLYIVAVTAALVWLVQPVYKGIYAVLLSVAEDKSVRARLRQTQTALRRGGVASWLCQQTAHASTALQAGFNKLYGGPRRTKPDAPETTPQGTPESASGAAVNTQAQPAAPPSTPCQKTTASLLQRTWPFLTRYSFLVSVCVAMSYSLGFMLFQQYSNLSATNAWRWALTAAYWLMLVVVAGRVRPVYRQFDPVGQRLTTVTFLLALSLGITLTAMLASSGTLWLWVIALGLALAMAIPMPMIGVLFLVLILVSVSVLSITTDWALVFALAWTLASVSAWIWALVSASAWILVSVLISVFAWVTIGTDFYALWQGFQYESPLFTVPWLGVSISFAKTAVAASTLLAAMAGLIAWKFKKQTQTMQGFAAWNLGLLTLGVAFLCALSLGQANTAQLLGEEQAHITPQDIGLFEFLAALPEATTKSTGALAQRMRSMALFLLLFVLPLINAVMDWLSVAFSRAQFAKLSRDLKAPQDGSNTSPKNHARNQWPRLSSGLWDIGLDALGAVFFKLVVLSLLTFWAWVIDGRGVSFTWQAVSHYWQMLWPLSPVPFSPQALLEGNNLLISLMIATTLVPTLLHSAWVLLVVSVKGLAALSRSVVFAALWQPKLGAAVLSVLCVCGLVGGVYWANKTIQGQTASIAHP